MEFIFANDVWAILPYTKNVLCCDILNAPVNGSGYNQQFGLLSSNKSTEESVKLFLRDCQTFVDKLAASLREATGK